MENAWPYIFVALKIAGVIAGSAALFVILGCILGIIWGACTRNGARYVFPEEGPAVPITRRFSRSSWYGRLLLTAYGYDRGWIVFLRRMSGFTGYRPPSWPALPDGATDEMKLADRVDYSRRCQESHARCLTFHRLPPYLQPFFPDAPRSNLCPTFWKVMFASWVYVLGVALSRAVFAALAHTWHLVADPIAAGFRYVFRRFGRAIGYGFAFSAYAAALSGAVYGAWYGSMILSKNMDEPVTTPALVESLARQHEEMRRKLERALVSSCQIEVAWYGSDNNWVRFCDSYAVDSSHEQDFMACEKREFPYRWRIANISREESNCTRVFLGSLNEFFPSEKEQKALAGRIAAALRRIFADELAKEDEEYRAGLAKARLRDAEAVIAARTELEQYTDAEVLYTRFQDWCYEDTEGWRPRFVAPDKMNNATCAALAAIFKDKIEAGKAAILDRQQQAAWRAEWIAFKQTVRESAPSFGLWVFVSLAVGGILALLSIFAWRYRAVILSILDQVGNGIWYSFLILTAPVWVPLRYLVWPALKLCWRGARAIWMLAWLSGLRAAILGIGAGIRRVALAIRQIWRDTWIFVRAFLSAKWERLCPLIEWED